ncbi:phenylacetate--CoA ligase family protein [Actinotalea ferrariae]|uniref:phenylacetate--CoA ligase family protein n=1 Tax=Actinotalea ferrariae TaxID=1386098 RepID=UPI001C8B7B2A|nr:hypothetical protein [Actinotalea ferrariae]MBX9245010.1 phenylacetate--CoA ligase family protein [Actinotalea ferrariae]
MNLREVAFTTKTRTVRRPAGAFYQDLLRNERLSPDELADLQWRRAQDILDLALRETAFYPRHYADLGLTPGTRLTREDWSRLPILDRATVKENAADMATPAANDRTSRPALTGGSTGEPLRTRHDARVPTLAHSWRMYRWWGVEPWDDLARIGRWGFGRFATLKNDLSWWPTRQRYTDAGLLSPESMRQFHRDVVRIRPALIEGYVGSMLEFADFMEAEGLRVDPPTAVATTAAPLTSSTRSRLEEVFGAPVYDEYRGAEIGWMAGECRMQDGLHVFADTRLLEVVDADGNPLPPGETGDIVITDLTNRVFPLIRYRLGDHGTLMDGACACGISLPRMHQPDGRSTDLLRLPGGRSMGHRLMGMFGSHPEAVRLFQIHQQADYSIVVRVVEGDGADARTHIEQAVDNLRRRVGGAVPVTVEYVDALPYTRGKIKYVISDVAPAG